MNSGVSSKAAATNEDAGPEVRVVSADPTPGENEGGGGAGTSVVKPSPR